MRMTNPPGGYQMSGGWNLPRWRSFVLTFVLEQLVGNDSRHRTKYIDHILTHIKGEKIFDPARDDNFHNLDQGFVMLQHTKHLGQRWILMYTILYESGPDDLYAAIQNVASLTPTGGEIKLIDVSIAALE